MPEAGQFESEMPSGSIEEAAERKRLAEFILRKRPNPLKEKLDAAVAEITEEEYADAEAEGYTRAEWRNFRRAEIHHQARQAYRKLLQENPNIKPADMDDEMFLMYYEQKTEDGMREWYGGKTPEEMEAIFDQRMLWSTIVAHGIDASQLQALGRFDIKERKAFFATLLARGDDSMIANYATNPGLRALYSWPAPSRMKQINAIRVPYGKAPLPLIFSAEKVLAATEGKWLEDESNAVFLKEHRRRAA